jgi:hypothetical protein
LITAGRPDLAPRNWHQFNCGQWRERILAVSSGAWGKIWISRRALEGKYPANLVGFGLRLALRTEKLVFYNYASTSSSHGIDVQTLALVGG